MPGSHPSACVCDPEEKVYESAGRIARTCLTAARDYEKGVLPDTDAEYLHKYRVSLRRVRSMLSLFKGVYERGDNRRARALLSGIMERTGRLRDLDVYLMERERYAALVPASMRPGLEAAFHRLARERQKELNAVGTFFSGAEYGRQLDALQTLFGAPQTMRRGEAADAAAGQYARRLIRKRCRKLAGIARSFNEDMSEACIHELRIECKKFRYLLEFFLPLLPQCEFNRRVKSMKELQDVLGQFNDYRVQCRLLAAFMDDHSGAEPESVCMRRSIEAVVAALQPLKLKARSEIGACLDGFIYDNRQPVLNDLAPDEPG